MNYHE